MQEMELTWGQVIRIWWAAFWRWFVLSNLIIGAIVGIIAIGLWAVGIRFIPLSPWAMNVVYILAIPPGFVALRLALKAPYRGFRVVIVAAAEEP